MRVAKLLILITLLTLGACGADDGPPSLRVAVAANFLSTFEVLAESFEARTGHHLEITSGSTGALFSQIKNGAPVDAFFSADERRPLMLEQAGLTVAGTRRTYARGRLALVSKRHPAISGGADALRDGAIRTIAVANAKTAPYGRAAREALDHADLATLVDGRLVEGTSVGQVFSMVLADADAGFVAWSQAIVHELPHVWVVPEHLHDPIRQDVVLLERAADNEAARALLEYLTSEEAAEIIRRHGYGVDDR